MPDNPRSRDELASRYLDQLEFDPYPIQEEALLAWFAAGEGVLVCTPTGTGKTLIAEAAMFEALHLGRRAYYSTPLIALTEQKLQEMQRAAVRWGFRADDVGLVTGNRRVNPDAPILVVVAEILFNRLLHPEMFDFDQVSAVVMDEFHSFNDPERGIVWEFSLGLLPKQVRLLLLSATVGNAYDFVSWLRRAHQRNLELVQSTTRKVPLTYHWVGDQLLNEQLESMAAGSEEVRRVPALVFCFNRDECWDVAEQLKGKRLQQAGQQAELVRILDAYDWSQGAGPKLRPILLRGVGVHHARVLPKYRRIVEELFQRKLLSVCVCTETLAAGINLPARSVVLPNLMKGPPEKKKLIDASAAHQMFGRAGRPQYDTQGYVFALAHEDDVKILRWREKYDQIPEDTKDPGLRKAKKALKRKMPTRRTNEQYWTEAQFTKMTTAPPARLASRGPLPWRLLVYMLDASSDVELIRQLVGKRLLDSKRIEADQKALDRMLHTLWTAGYVSLEPEPPKTLPNAGFAGKPEGALSSSRDKKDERDQKDAKMRAPRAHPTGSDSNAGVARNPEDIASSTAIGAGLPTIGAGLPTIGAGLPTPPSSSGHAPTSLDAEGPSYRPRLAHATETLQRLLVFRSVNPLYGVFLVQHLGIADWAERIEAIESVLELPYTVGRFLRVPGPDERPPGPLATTRLDVQLLQLGLATPEQLGAGETDEPDRRRGLFEDEPVRPLTLADKLRMLFDYDFPGVHDVQTNPVWAAGELLEFGGDFNKFITSKRLQKQEGIVFRHLLRMILLVREFQLISPPDTSAEAWRSELDDIARRIAESCRQVDPTSTDKILEQAATVGEV